MADDVRERIRQGDLDALLDPALPLHLLADGLTADWWVEGTEACVASVVSELWPHASPAARAAWSFTRGSYLVRVLRLRALLPGAPAEVDAALEVLERYAR